MNKTGIELAEELKKSYITYLKSTYSISDMKYANKFQVELSKEEKLINGPLLELVPEYVSDKSMKSYIEEGLLHKKFLNIRSGDSEIINRNLYSHQVKAIKKICEEDKGIIVSTGTGSGKTESFLYPIYNNLLKKFDRDGKLEGVNVLLIYPMNALVNDQYKRILNDLKLIPEITCKVYTGDTIEAEREQIRQTPPNILITNYVMLEYLMLRPEDKKIFTQKSKQFEFIVLDEAHSYKGVHASEISMLLRRFVNAINTLEKIKFAVTSATLAGDKSEILEFASRLCADYMFDESMLIQSKIVEHIPNNELKRAKSDLCDLGIKYAGELSDIYAKELYDLLVNSYEVFELRRLLEKNSLSVYKLMKNLDLSDKEFQDLLILCKKAKKNKSRLLDTKYHTFVKALEGVFISFGTEKLSTKKKYKDSIVNSDITFNYYEISVCEYCGDIYIHGEIIGDRFEQGKSSDSFYNEDKFLVKYDIKNIKELYDVNDYEIYELCTSCGKSIDLQTVNIPNCVCNVKKIFLIRKRLGIKDKEKRNNNKLIECISCKVTNTNTGVLRAFYTGTDASTSVVASALFENINETIIKLDDDDAPADNTGFIKPSVASDERREKQFLAFSDSVKEAAYFAASFQRRYEDIQINRILYKNLVQNNGVKINFKNATGKMMNYMNNNKDKFIRDDYAEYSIYSLLKGMVDISMNSMIKLGILNFELDIYYNKLDLTILDKKNLPLFYSLVNYFVDRFISHGALNYYEEFGVDLSKEDYEDLFFTTSKSNITTNARKKNAISIHHSLENGNNKLTDIFNRYKFLGDKEKFLKDTFSSLQTLKIIIKSEDSFYLDINRINIYSPYVANQEYMMCNKCGRKKFISSDEVEFYDLKNNNSICDKYQCKGSYTFEDSKEYYDKLEENHYFKIYTTNKIEKMIVNEHTSQIDRIQGATYQKDFKRGDINVLSSTTTFEMGIDVGGLETVFMRNVPPLPSNYIQRAGRAGRSTDSIAFIVTYAKMSNHDFRFFNDPNKMINGVIRNVPLKLNNVKIFKRHLAVYIVSKYWEYVGERTKRAIDFFSDDEFNKIIKYIKCNRTMLLDELAVINNEFNYEELEIMLDDFIKNIADERSAFYLSYEAVNSIEVDKLSENSIRIRDNMKKEKIINRLVDANIFPKYGFPTDVQGLTLNRGINGYKQNVVQRSIQQAISDYGPGSEVIINKVKYRSRYINLKNKFGDKLVTTYKFICTNEECDNEKHFDHFANGETDSYCCDHCNSPMIRENILIPIDGFTTDKSNTKNIRSSPRKTFRTNVKYVGSSDNYSAPIDFKTNDKLYIENNDEYFFCSKCGYMTNKKELKTKSDMKHITPSGVKCDGDFGKEKYKIGAEINTDITIIKLNEYLDRPTRLSLMYALKEAFIRMCGCEKNDVGILSRVLDGKTEIIFYDDVPGGAGYSKEVSKYFKDEELRNKILELAINTIETCDCGSEEETNIACYNCLLDYWNSRDHDIITKQSALIGLHIFRTIFSKI